MIKEKKKKSLNTKGKHYTFLWKSQKVEEGYLNAIWRHLTWIHSDVKEIDSTNS